MLIILEVTKFCLAQGITEENHGSALEAQNHNVFLKFQGWFKVHAAFVSS